jgi:hypothetical protein
MGKPSRSSSFSPASIAGLKLWLKADAGLYQERTGASATTLASADADPVGSWLDQSGQASHMVAPIDGRRPTVKLSLQNGLPVVRFDGVDDLLTAAAVPQTATTFTIFMTFRFRSLTGANQQITHVGTSSNGYGFAANTSNNRDISFHGVSLLVDSAASTSTEIWSAYRTGGTTTMRVNGVDVSITNGTATPTAPATTAGVGGLPTAVGAGTSPATCDAMELLLYDSALSGANVALVEAYLNSRWGVY